MLLKKKLDEMTTEMKLANEPPYASRSVELTYSEAMLIWGCLDLRDAIRDAVGK